MFIWYFAVQICALIFEIRNDAEAVYSTLNFRLSVFEYISWVLQNFHPTKRLLVETVSQLLDTKAPQSILIDEVLQYSRVTRGSMYHHFEDLNDLIQTTQIYRYSRWIDVSIEFITRNVATAQSKEELHKALSRLTEITQDDQMARARSERALALAACADNPRMAKELGQVTKRLTDEIADVVEELKNKGFFREEVDSLALATFIQAYTLGKLVNDFNPTGVDQAVWNAFIMNVAEKTFLK